MWSLPWAQRTSSWTCNNTLSTPPSTTPLLLFPTCTPASTAFISIPLTITTQALSLPPVPPPTLLKRLLQPTHYHHHYHHCSHQISKTLQNQSNQTHQTNKNPHPERTDIHLFATQNQTQCPTRLPSHLYPPRSVNSIRPPHNSNMPPSTIKDFVPKETLCITSNTNNQLVVQTHQNSAQTHTLKLTTAHHLLFHSLTLYVAGSRTITTLGKPITTAST